VAIERPSAPIGINGRFLMSWGRETAGVHRAAWNWLLALVREAPAGRRFVVATGRTPENEAALAELEALGSVELLLSPIPRRRGGTHVWEQLRLGPLLQKSGCAVMANLANTMPLRPRMRSLLAVMDTSFMERAAWFRLGFRAWYSVLVPSLLRRADRIVTISEFSRREILRRFPILPEKVEVVGLGADHAHPAASETRRENEPGWAPPGVPYILYLGSIEPRKNIPLLIEAFRRLKRRAPDLPHRLVLAGGTARIFRKERFAGVEGVQFTGYLPESQLPAFYRGADLFVFPSRYEGFGLPPLEAMAAGVATLVARAGALPETAGNGADLFDPDSPDELAFAMERLLRDSKARAALAERGRKRAAVFRWQEAGRRLNRILDLL